MRRGIRFGFADMAFGLAMLSELVRPAGRPAMGEPDSALYLKLAEKVAGSDATVLVLGETGTGKEGIARFIHDATAMLVDRADLRINCFGHLGDGNLHFNLFPAAGTARDAYDGIRTGLSRAVHEMVVARGGSFSAEHGVGRLKAAELGEWGDPARLAAMRAIKDALDPAGIMNPGVILA